MDLGCFSRGHTPVRSQAWVGGVQDFGEVGTGEVFASPGPGTGAGEGRPRGRGPSERTLSKAQGLRPPAARAPRAVAKQRLQRTQDTGRVLGGRVLGGGWGRGRGREIFRAVCWGRRPRGRRGWGDALKRALSRVRALLPAVTGGRGAQGGGAGAPDTCWG